MEAARQLGFVFKGRNSSGVAVDMQVSIVQSSRTPDTIILSTCYSWQSFEVLT